MRLPGFLLIILLLCAPAMAYCQWSADSSFSLLINLGRSFTRANDPHINRWLQKYGYPPEPHVPSSLNLELAALPSASRFMYSLRLSTINSGENFSAFNLLGGLYIAAVKTKRVLLYFGSGLGYHDDIITLNGDMPADYKQLAATVRSPLSLRRTGLVVEPALRFFWFPVQIHNVQLGLTASAGYDLDLNSRWKLGYYGNNHGKYNHFHNLKKPDDQQRVSEYGLSYGAGLCLRINLH